MVMCGMPPSKLDKYLSILEVLVFRPRKLDSIAYRVNMECRAVKKCLDFLVSNGLVEEQRFSEKRIIYAINERGLSVFKTLRALKYLEKLKKTLPIVEEAREVASVLNKHSQKWREQ
jgi:predicted transcriptional regulator